MKSEDIIRWVRTELEPVCDLCSRNAYRCAAYLKDGLYLPCVLFREAQAHADLALSRFKESRESGITDPGNLKPGHYPTVVKHFVTTGNRVNLYDIDRVEPSPYAIPVALLSQVHGETSMSWTQFAAILDNGTEVAFGTSYLMEFFDIPNEFSWERVVKIVCHRSTTQPVYRQRPYFTCFVDYVDFGEFRVPQSDRTRLP